MSLAGSIAVAVEFRNSTTSTGVQSLKTIEMRDTTAYATGKVAIVSGTVGTTSTLLWNLDGLQFGGYRDATGQLVQFAAVTRIAMRASGPHGTVVRDATEGIVELLSINNDVAIGNNIGFQIDIHTLSGTASFTAVLYGT